MMTETHIFLMPDYYPDFACKISACRRVCCEGWPVSMSMENYFRLLGMDCPPDLRARLDCGMHLCDHPTGERYAQFTPRWDGNCPMRLEDGRCSIHAELGEDAQPDICRLYPRGIRTDGGYECSCANSCEAVLELFFGRREPIRFIRREMTVKTGAETGGAGDGGDPGGWLKTRLDLMETMENGPAPLAGTLLLIGEMMGAAVPSAGTGQTVDGGLEAALRLVGRLSEESDSIRVYGEDAVATLGEPDAYRFARDRFESVLPEWERFFRHALTNHMFFTRFPDRSRGTAAEEWASLCAVYVLLRVLCVGTDVRDGTSLVDVCAAAFRLTEHTDFTGKSLRILKETGDDSPEIIRAMIRL